MKKVSFKPIRSLDPALLLYVDGGYIQYNTPEHPGRMVVGMARGHLFLDSLLARSQFAIRLKVGG